MTFRLHAEEYELLLSACASTGVRSISEFARAAVLQRAQQDQSEGPGTLSGDLSILSDRLGALDASLEDARKRIRVVMGSSTKVGT